MSMKVTKEEFVGVTYEEMMAENERLRELVSDLYCDLRKEVNDCWLEEYQKQMQEAGIEMDEWGWPKDDA